MPARTSRQLLRTWFTDPVSVPLYVALSALALVLALAAEPEEFGWTLFGVYLVLSCLSVRAQRTVSTT